MPNYKILYIGGWKDWLSSNWLHDFCNSGEKLNSLFSIVNTFFYSFGANKIIVDGSLIFYKFFVCITYYFHTELYPTFSVHGQKGQLS
jgi:hypothetical protein